MHRLCRCCSRGLFRFRVNCRKRKREGRKWGDRPARPDGRCRGCCPQPGRSRWMRQRPLPAQKTRWGGGLRDLVLRLGERGRGHHPAGKRGRQAEAQKRPPSLLSHGGSPSLAGWASSSGAQNHCQPVSILWLNIPLRSAFRNPKRRGRICSVCRRGRGRQVAEGPLATFARAAPLAVSD